MRILVACDLTARSKRALARSFLLARELNAELRVLHVVDNDLTDSFRAYSVDWAKKALEVEAGEFSALSNVEPRIEVRTGDPRQEIAKEAQAGSTDLVVFGVHGRRSAGSGSFAETTAGRVLKCSFTAALLVTDEPREPYQGVVIGIDLSMFSRTAIRQARRIAPAARVSLVHAYQIPFEGFLAGSGIREAVADEQRSALDAFLKEEMNALERRTMAAEKTEIPYETVIAEGPPPQVLRATCERIAADLLVIGTHSRSSISRMIWGSVAIDLLDDPPCDVLVAGPI